jgi:uncharacterized DUF497 family protein
LLPLLFDWDADNIGHVGCHGLTPEEVEEALLDPDRVGDSAYAVDGERWSAFIGSTQAGRTLFVVTTLRRRRVRVVTAREAAARERRHYRRRKAQG